MDFQNTPYNSGDAVSQIMGNSGGFSSPEEAAQIYQLSQKTQDIQGLATKPVVDTTAGWNGKDTVAAEKLYKAQQAFKNGGLGFSPPSTKRMFGDMLGGLLIGYAAALLLGADGKAATAIGLLAAGGNMDADKAEMDRWSVIQSQIAKGGDYDPEALYAYMKTGNDKALRDDIVESNKRKDALLGEQWKREDAQTAETWKQQDQALQNNFELNKENMIQNREDARTAAEIQSRIQAAAIKAGANGGNAQGATPYGYMTDSNGDGKPDTWIATTSRGTVDKDNNGNVHQFKLTPAGGWVDMGYMPDVGAGGNGRSDTAARNSQDALGKMADLANMQYSTHSSSLGRGLNTLGNHFTGNKNDFNKLADVVNNSMGALLSDNAVMSTGGKAVLKEDMKQQIASGGKINAGNSAAVNQHILNNDIKFASGVKFIDDYQNSHNGQFPSVEEYEQGRDHYVVQFYKDHPNALNAFGEEDDQPGGKSNINNYPSADKKDYSKLWK